MDYLHEYKHSRNPHAYSNETRDYVGRTVSPFLDPATQRKALEYDRKENPGSYPASHPASYPGAPDPREFLPLKNGAPAAPASADKPGFGSFVQLFGNGVQTDMRSSFQSAMNGQSVDAAGAGFVAPRHGQAQLRRFRACLQQWDRNGQPEFPGRGGRRFG